jgi:hypothetical protein
MDTDWLVERSTDVGAFNRTEFGSRVGLIWQLISYKSISSSPHYSQALRKYGEVLETVAHKRLEMFSSTILSLFWLSLAFFWDRALVLSYRCIGVEV